MGGGIKQCGGDKKAQGIRIHPSIAGGRKKAPFLPYLPPPATSFLSMTMGISIEYRPRAVPGFESVTQPLINRSLGRSLNQAGLRVLSYKYRC